MGTKKILSIVIAFCMLTATFTPDTHAAWEDNSDELFEEDNNKKAIAISVVLGVVVTALVVVAVVVHRKKKKNSPSKNTAFILRHEGGPTGEYPPPPGDRFIDRAHSFPKPPSLKLRVGDLNSRGHKKRAFSLAWSTYRETGRMGYRASAGR